MDPATIALLVRMWIAEAGWAREVDHAAQGHIMLRAAEKSDLQTAVHNMVDRFSFANTKHPWLLEIDSSCRAPVLYPGTWPLEKCQVLVDRAIALLQGRLADPCHGKAQQWRARKSKALRRALRKGYIRVGCGRTNNAYLAEEPK